MRLAIFADIHANRQAFAACLEAARAKGAERMVCLGDIVGYGADPEWAADTVMELAATGRAGRARQSRQRHCHQCREHERRGPGRDRMDAGPPQRAPAPVPCRPAFDGRGGDAPLCPLRSFQSAALALCARCGGCRAQHDRDLGARHLLRPHPSPGALFDVGDRQDDELRARDRRSRAVAARAAMARRARLGRPAARRQSRRIVRDVRYREMRDHLLPRPL